MIQDGNILKNKGIRASEPYKLLGVPRRKRGYDLSYISSNQHGRIQVWSFYKPYNFPGQKDELTDDQIRSINMGLYFHLEDDPESKILSEHGTSMDFIQKLIDGRWSYDPPQNGDYCRLEDWKGYRTLANAPVSNGEDITVELSHTSIPITIGRSSHQITYTQGAEIGDFGALIGKHYAIYVYSTEKGSDRHKSWIAFITADKIIEAGMGNYTMSIPESVLNYVRNIVTDVDIHYLMVATSNEEVGVEFTSSHFQVWPLPCEGLPGGRLIFNQSAQFKFTLLGVANVPTDTVKDINQYIEQYVEREGDVEYIVSTHLGTGNDGNITLFGSFVNKSNSIVQIPYPRPFKATLRPTLSGASGSNNARLYKKTASGKYEFVSQSTTIYIGIGETIDVALEFVSLARLTPSGGSMTQPIRDYVRNAILTMQFVGSSGSATAGMFASSINICVGGDKTYKTLAGEIAS